MVCLEVSPGCSNCVCLSEGFDRRSGRVAPPTSSREEKHRSEVHQNVGATEAIWFGELVREFKSLPWAARALAHTLAPVGFHARASDAKAEEMEILTR